jgi:hypothetical protein
LYFLEGWTSLRMGDESNADDAFGRMEMIRPRFPRPDAGHNALILVETGSAPRKVADGIGHSELVYRPGKVGDEISATVIVDGGSVSSCYPLEDFYFQASTRGGRAVDRILEGKLVYRQAGEDVANVLSDFSTALSDVGLISQPHSTAGLAVGGAAAVVSLIASGAEPHADIRYWKNLPHALHAHTAELAPGEHTIEVQFYDAAGHLMPGLSQQRTFEFDPEDPSTTVQMVFSRTQLYSVMLIDNDEPWKSVADSKLKTEE